MNRSLMLFVAATALSALAAPQAKAQYGYPPPCGYSQSAYGGSHYQTTSGMYGVTTVGTHNGQPYSQWRPLNRPAPGYGGSYTYPQATSGRAGYTTVGTHNGQPYAQWRPAGAPGYTGRYYQTTSGMHGVTNVGTHNGRPYAQWRPVR